MNIVALTFALALTSQLAPAVERDLPAASVVHNDVAVYFSPRGGCTEAIIKKIESAESSLYIMAYSFTSAPIAKSVVEAKQRGVDVKVVLDPSQARQQYSSATFLHNHGLPVLVDGTHRLQHNKVIIIDDNVVITGSFNFSAAAESENAENLIIFGDHTEIAQAFKEEFSKHEAHSAEYIGFAKPLVEGDAKDESKPSPDSSSTVYRTKSGKAFHKAGCPYLKSNIPVDRSQALSQGLRPCSQCSP